MTISESGRAGFGSPPRGETGRVHARNSDGRVVDPLIGKVIADRYRIVSQLGKGGMGVVYKVEHLRIGKLMAMKLLTGELSRNREVVRRFKREALAASKLTSVNTVQVWDFGHSEGLTYLVMELVAGEDFGKFLKQHGPLPFDRVAKIAAQVCNSLIEAHDRGIVHRDLKPENLILLETGSDQRVQEIVKVLDFGLAKLHDEDPQSAAARAQANEITTTGAIVGTPFYMAPEQIRGEEVDGRADLYALGAMIYRAITGVPPFEGTSPLAVLTMHLTEPLVPPHERAPKLGIPPEASEIVMKLMAKDRDDRYPSAQAVRDALIAYLVKAGVSGGFLRSGAMQAIAESEGIDRVTPTNGPMVRPATRDEVDAYARRLRRNAIFAGGLALVLIGLAIWVVQGWRRASAPAAVANNAESEPNDTSLAANPLLFGAPVHGYLGKRASPEVGDEDVYSLDVPDGSDRRFLEIDLGAIPNLPLCLSILEGANATPVATLCRPRGLPIHVDAFAVKPGRVFLRVAQDRSPKVAGGEREPIYENVSDPYTLRVSLAVARAGLEIEPNDSFEEAQKIGAGQEIDGRLGWRGDRDVYCPAAGARVVVVDHVGGENASAPTPIVVSMIEQAGTTGAVAGEGGRYVASAGACVAIDRSPASAPSGDGTYLVTAELPNGAAPP